MESIGATEPLAPEGAPLEPTSVYRYYDRHGLLIYVGITKQGIGRNQQHNQKAEWWPHVVRQEVEHLPSRQAALLREKQLIHQYRPPFNKQHNRGHVEQRDAYLALVDAPIPDEPPALQYRKLLGGYLPLEVVRRDDDALLLRTRVEHAPLAAALAVEQEMTPVYHWGYTGARCGLLKRLDVVGSVAYLTCEPNKRMPQVIAAATVRLGWRSKTKQAGIRNLHLHGEGPVAE